MLRVLNYFLANLNPFCNFEKFVHFSLGVLMEANVSIRTKRNNPAIHERKNQVVRNENPDILKYVLNESDTGELTYEEDLKLMVYAKLKMDKDTAKSSTQKKYLTKCSKAYKKYFCML